MNGPLKFFCRQSLAVLCDRQPLCHLPNGDRVPAPLQPHRRAASPLAPHGLPHALTPTTFQDILRSYHLLPPVHFSTGKPPHLPCCLSTGRHPLHPHLCPYWVHVLLPTPKTTSPRVPTALHPSLPPLCLPGKALARPSCLPPLPAPEQLNMGLGNHAAALASMDHAGTRQRHGASLASALSHLPGSCFLLSASSCASSSQTSLPLQLTALLLSSVRTEAIRRWACIFHYQGHSRASAAARPFVSAPVQGLFLIPYYLLKDFLVFMNLETAPDYQVKPSLGAVSSTMIFSSCRSLRSVAWTLLPLLLTPSLSGAPSGCPPTVSHAALVKTATCLHAARSGARSQLTWLLRMLLHAASETPGFPCLGQHLPLAAFSSFTQALIPRTASRPSPYPLPRSLDLGLQF